MITIVVPTRNRAHTIRRVGASLFSQQFVDQIVFVDDGGSDDTHAVLAELSLAHPKVELHILRNETRQGASYGRIRGYEAARNEFVLYVDDDVWLAPGYAATCLRKLVQTGAAIASGRRITKRPEQDFRQAIAEFGLGTQEVTPFRHLFCEFREEAVFDGDIDLPLTHNAILTRRTLLQKFSYDPHYSRGNGYREESDYQMNVFVHGHRIVVTNEAHCVELSRRESRTGGQRTNRFAQLYWSVRYTGYFYGKYYARYAKRVGLQTGRGTALVLFAFYQVYMLFVRPTRRLLPRRRSARIQAPVSIPAE